MDVGRPSSTARDGSKIDEYASCQPVARITTSLRMMEPFERVRTRPFKDLMAVREMLISLPSSMRSNMASSWQWICDRPAEIQNRLSYYSVQYTDGFAKIKESQ